MKRCRSTVLASTGFLLLVAIASSRLAAQSVPPLINYQGRLVGSNGVPLATADYELTFSLWNAATSGSQVWGPQHFDNSPGPGHGAKVPVVQGWFNVILGPLDTTGTPLTDAFNATSRYFEIRVAADAPVLPRHQILSAPYAFSADRANLAVMAGAVANGAVTLAAFSPEVFAKLSPVPFMEFVTVDNPGNAADRDYGAGQFGAVNYTYRIGKYEVNNHQYAAFLNAIAVTDTYGLYNDAMGVEPFGGINRSGSSGSYIHAHN